MTKMRRGLIVLLTLIGPTLSLGACAAKAQVRSELPVPPLDPPAPPPRVVATYEPEPEPIAVAPPVEPATPVKPTVRPPRPEQKPEPAAAVSGSP